MVYRGKENTIMNKAKKTASVLIAGMMGVSLLAGCGSSRSTVTTTQTGSNVQTGSEAAPAGGDTGSRYHMSYVMSVRDEYLSLLENAVVKAADENDVDMDLYYCENDSSRMIQYIEQSVNEDVDAILVNVVASEDQDACMEAAGDTPLVFLNKAPADTSKLNERTVFVASDENLSGAYQGQFIADYFNAAGQTDVSYILLRGTEGLVHTDLRTNNAIAEMEAGGLNLTEVATIMGDYDRTAAAEGMTELINSGADFDVIVSNNDAMALGAIQALKDAGIDPSSKVIVGIDATSDALAALDEGSMKMTVLQDAIAQGDAAVMSAINIIEGNELTAGTNYTVSADNPYIIYVPFVKITP